MKTLKRIKLLDANKEQNDILKNSQLKSILGGYITDYKVTCQHKNAIGGSNSYDCYGTCAQCKTAAINAGCIEDTIKITPNDC